MTKPKSISGAMIQPYAQQSFWDAVHPLCFVHKCGKPAAYVIRFNYQLRPHVTVHAARNYCEEHTLRFADKYGAPLKRVV